jgi:hypothetical protein
MISIGYRWFLISCKQLNDVHMLSYFDFVFASLFVYEVVMVTDLVCYYQTKVQSLHNIIRHEEAHDL